MVVFRNIVWGVWVYFYPNRRGLGTHFGLINTHLICKAIHISAIMSILLLYAALPRISVHAANITRITQILLIRLRPLGIT